MGEDEAFSVGVARSRVVNAEAVKSRLARRCLRLSSYCTRHWRVHGIANSEAYVKLQQALEWWKEADTRLERARAEYVRLKEAAGESNEPSLAKRDGRA